jgi:hypothetical protein
MKPGTFLLVAGMLLGSAARSGISSVKVIIRPSRFILVCMGGSVRFFD